jgi:intein/homing endonuclease
MIKKALLVGCNDYKSVSDLRGCLNDVSNIKDVLKKLYGYDDSEIVTLTNSKATDSAIRSKLAWLTNGVSAGDQLFFHFSGHGCFSGETTISLLNGEDISLKELEKTYKGKEFWVYSIDQKTQKIVPGRAHSPRITQMAKVIQVTLDNGESIKCTPDHLFMLRDGTYLEASCLTPGTSLMPLYKRISEKGRDAISGYEMIYNPGRYKYDYTHRVVAYGLGMYSIGENGVVHHKDFCKTNNSPNNLQFMSKEDHAKLHMLSEDRSKYLTSKLLEKMSDPEWRREFGKKSSEARKLDWTKKEYRDKVISGVSKSFIDKENDPRIIALHANRHLSHTKEAQEKRRISFAKTFRDLNNTFYKNMYSEETRNRFHTMKNKGNHVRWHESRGIHSSTCAYCMEDAVVLNHKVVCVVETNEVVPVYDITVDVHHNFALSSGVFVHNSQIKDRNKDEADGLDEFLCCYNMDWSRGIILDDEFDSIFSVLPVGVEFEAIFDCCHSGTNESVTTRDLLPGIDRVERFLPPPDEMRVLWENQKVTHWFGASLEARAVAHRGKFAVWSGCGETQTSADAYINRSFNGAFTYYFCDILRAHGGQISRRELLKILRDTLVARRYKQIPELTCTEDIADSIFLK